MTNSKYLLVVHIVITSTFILFQGVDSGFSANFTIIDTGQTGCYSNTRLMTCPGDGDRFDGQDAQYHGIQPAYSDNGDGTITDLNTGLVWQKTPSRSKLPFYSAQKGAVAFKLAGYEDWRLPTIKELYSLIDFRGNTGKVKAESIPFINSDYFDFYYGDTSRGERLIDAQFWSATEYSATTMHNNPTAFGVNFADGRIKGYPIRSGRGGGRDNRYVRYVRGNPKYGINEFVDNKDGTITDQATGLIWAKKDSGKKFTWEEALHYAEVAEISGYSDWRLPNAKELQSIVDYSRSPGARNIRSRGPAIDQIFDVSETESWYWTSTTHLEHGRAASAVYLCFGRAWGYLRMGGAKKKVDVHGAGSQRSDPKSGNPAKYKTGRGPQGDEVRIYNYVRLVRGGGVTKSNRVPEVEKGRYPFQASTAERGTSLIHPSREGISVDHSGGPAGQPRGRKGKAPIPPGKGFVARLDMDGDGRVSKSEFDGPINHFKILDLNHDGYLTDEEGPKGPPPPRRQW